MANGFFLGGAAEGMMNAQKQALAEQTQQQDVGLRTRGLDLQEQQFANTVSRQAQADIDKQIADTLSVVDETIKNSTAVGRTPDQIMKAVTPLVQSAQALAAKVGRNPDAIAARVQAQISSPTAVETGTAKGQASAAQRVAEAHGIAAATGQGVDISPFKEEKDRIAAEKGLRNDFERASTRFVTIRDFYDRMKSATDSGYGDITRVYAFMKLQDPETGIKENEYATAANASGVPDATRNLYNKLLNGDKLSKNQREGIMAEAAKIWAGSLNRHSTQVTQFRNIAKRSGLRPDQVIIDYTAGSEGPIGGTTSSGINWNLK